MCGEAEGLQSRVEGNGGLRESNVEKRRADIAKCRKVEIREIRVLENGEEIVPSAGQ